MKISLPLTTALYVSDYNHATHKHRNIQAPLGGHFAKEGSFPESLSHHNPLTNMINMMHTTTVTVGDPPQTFRAMIDLSWTEFFVPSSKCTEKWCDSLSKYYSAFSRSYKPNGTAVDLQNPWVQTSGFLSSDILQVAGVKIDDMHFEEATSVNFPTMYHELRFDTVLGLAPYHAGSAKNHLSPLSAMKSQGLLDRNLFSLRLSRGDMDGPGELTLGGINNDLYSGDLTFMPATEGESQWTRGKWQVDLQGLFFGDGKEVHQSFDQYTAVFETDHPYIYVERHTADGINSLIGAEPIDFYPDSIPCERRSELPDLTLTLNGQNFTISPYDYTLEVMIEKHGQRCLSSFVGLMPPGEPFLVLGSAFLKSFVSVFNIDDKTVGLAPAKHVCFHS